MIPLRHGIGSLIVGILLAASAGGLAHAQAVIAAPAAIVDHPGPAGPAPASPTIGAQLTTATNILNIPPGRFFAVLFLQGNFADNVKVCQRFATYYTDSLRGFGQYTQRVYLAKFISAGPASLDCTKPQAIYDPQIWTYLSDDLQLDGPGFAPLLVVVSRTQDGHFRNMGFVNFSDGDDHTILKKMTDFNIYYRCDPHSWQSGFEIDPQSHVSDSIGGPFGWASGVATYFFGGKDNHGLCHHSP
jgi:hypothetical protein